ncbi:helix-turn-helix transcriptional regulator [Nocardia sp. NBC_01503]|uniref:helix-turn-helix transcriptional regulator n=1 Tax=Nocardia sp. NBC_01503 TaxID=2975997 RepID=UPI002E7C0FEE|nr:helix-turn-helix transcriptional regulator [Nocardia sp. NBC_01503]WTL32831.1 helix-turn-helix transcriptional regulator [Nocardia sp. NBC_01503]
MVSGDGNPGPIPSRHAQLGEFLRARRAKLQPGDVGLAPYGDPARRRTPGLRREEVAELSGVGLTWYTWLEQGRDVAASAQVIDALARTLRLDPDQHSHLRFLAGLAAPYDRTDDADRKRLQRLVDASMPNPAVIYAADFDYLVWNSAYTRVRHDPMELPPRQRNLLWMMFTDPDNRDRMPRWEFAARAVLSQLREAMGRRPGDPALATLVADLSEASPEFRRWWSEYPIRRFRPSTIVVEHAEVGVIELELFQLRPVENPCLLMVVQVPTGEIAAARMATLLAGARHSPNVTNSGTV